MTATTQSRSNAVRRVFGIVFQDPSLDNELTADENMELHGVLYGVPRASAEERIEELLQVRRAVGPAGRSREALLRAA